MKGCVIMGNLTEQIEQKLESVHALFSQSIKLNKLSYSADRDFAKVKRTDPQGLTPEYGQLKKEPNDARKLADKKAKEFCKALNEVGELQVEMLEERKREREAAEQGK